MLEAVACGILRCVLAAGAASHRVQLVHWKNQAFCTMRACLASRQREYKGTGKMKSSWHLPALPLYKLTPAKTNMDITWKFQGIIHQESSVLSEMVGELLSGAD